MTENLEDLAAVFRAAWHLADAQGREGERVTDGLKAVLERVTGPPRPPVLRGTLLEALRRDHGCERSMGWEVNPCSACVRRVDRGIMPLLAPPARASVTVVRNGAGALEIMSRRADGMTANVAVYADACDWLPALTESIDMVL